MVRITKYLGIFCWMLIGAGMYDLALKVKISYNESLPKNILCQQGIAYQQIGDGGTVYLKTKQECINESVKGNTNVKQQTTKSNQR